jgi:hypoxanthine-DNA glycosylase
MPPQSQQLARGFAPVVGRSPRVLLLGSLPGAASIAAGEYYAMRRNAFWPIMGALCGAGPELDYRDRLAALKQHGIALWDVLHAAVRPGSLDAAIVTATEQVNDIAALVGLHRSIRLVAFNGGKAAALFTRHVAPALAAASLESVTLPSTSPAHAALRPEQKLVRWRAALDPWLRAR